MSHEWDTAEGSLGSPSKSASDDKLGRPLTAYSPTRRRYEMQLANLRRLHRPVQLLNHIGVSRRRSLANPVRAVGRCDRRSLRDSLTDVIMRPRKS